MSISCIHKFNDSKWKYLVSSLLSKPTLNKQKTKIKDFTNYVTVQLTILIVSLQGYILFFWVMTFTNGMFLSSNSTFNNIYQTIEQFSNQCLTDAEILRCKLVSNVSIQIYNLYLQSILSYWFNYRFLCRAVFPF